MLSVDLARRREKRKGQELKIGQVVDVKAILSRGDRDYLVPSKGGGANVPISNLYEKYVLVCSFTQPFSHAICQSLEALYSELSLGSDILLVEFVLLLDYDFLSDPHEFHDFFRTLSFNCLTIPFSDYYNNNSCPLVFDSLPPGAGDGDGDVSCLAIHPSGLVLQNRPEFLYAYGASSYPFSKDHFDKIRRDDFSLKVGLSNTPSITLDQLLQCHSLPLLVDPNTFINTSSLLDKPVGLYLYTNGHHLHHFLYWHQQCLDIGLDFQFILVPIPYGNERHVNPAYFFEDMKESVLASCPSCSSWLTFPFNDKICRTLWRLHDCYSVDRLITIPHDGRPGDLYGGSILRMYGIRSYPFTSDAIVQKKMALLRSRTLESLLGDVPGLDIRNKNVILFIVNPYAYLGYHYSYEVMKREAPNIQKLFPDSLLYTVPLMLVSPGVLENLGFKVLPGGNSESIRSHIFLGNDPLCGETIRDCVVAFGKDGKVVSRFCHDHMQDLTAASIFDDQLYHLLWVEIQRRINNEHVY